MQKGLKLELGDGRSVALALPNTGERLSQDALDERIVDLVAEALLNHLARKNLQQHAAPEQPQDHSSEAVAPRPLSQPNKLLTVQQVAEALNVPSSWIYRQTRLGPQAIPFVRIGKYLRFDLEQVIAFFKNKQSPTHEPSRQSH